MKLAVFTWVYFLKYTYIFSVRVLSMVEAGLPEFWFKQGIGNSTSCNRLPTKVTVTSSFSLQNSWVSFFQILFFYVMYPYTEKNLCLFIPACLLLCLSISLSIYLPTCSVINLTVLRSTYLSFICQCQKVRQ